MDSEDAPGFDPETEFAVAQWLSRAIRERLPPTRELLDIAEADPVRHARILRDAAIDAHRALLAQFDLPSGMAEALKASALHLLDQQAEDWKRS